MKTEKYYLILAVITGILCTPALGQTKLPQPDERGLIGQADPALAGIEQLYVIIVPPDSEPNSKAILAKELEEKVKSKVSKAGIKTIRGITGNILHTGELRVDIEALKLGDSQQYVFRVQTSLSRAVYLAKTDGLSFKADVWKIKPVMQTVSVENMSAKVTSVVLKQVEAFIASHRAAAPPGAGPTDTNSAAAVPKRQVTPDEKPSVAEYKYVASKNSKVFHRPDCSSAKRISPKNLVGYNSREDAIKAGKRPCKICKP